MANRKTPLRGGRRRLTGGGAPRCAIESLETRQLLTNGYLPLNLVSDQAATALVQDSNLVNPWGLALNSQGGDLWVANSGSSVASLYSGGIAGFGGPATPFGPDTPAISLPGGTATGAAFNGSTSFFVSAGGVSGPASFLFAGLGGQISGYNRSVPLTPSTQAQLAATTSGAVYTGLAEAFNGFENLLYAADFKDNRIDVFDSSFNLVTTPGEFAADVPPGFAPYNIVNLAGQLYVSYAMQGAGNDAAAAAGGGFIDVFDVDGNFEKQLVASGGQLNAPWGMVQAPASFGDFSGDLLVANHGDGTIRAFNPQTGAFIATMALPSGAPLSIDGLRGLAFGNGLSSGGASELFFSAGSSNGSHGLLGAIQSAQGVSLTAQGNIVSATANQSFNGTLAVFSDAQNFSPGSFTATINWGDGTSSTSGIVSALAAGGYSVGGSHIYGTAGTKSISVQIRDSAGHTATASALAQVAVAGVSVTGLTFTPTESTVFNGAVATFIDGDGNTFTSPYQATINWGDGSVSPGMVSFAAGKFTVSGTHTYAEEGTQTATVTVTDTDSPTASANSIAKIADAPLTGTSAAITATLDALFSGTLGSFTDANPHASLSDFTATVDWGDGTVSAGTISAGLGQTFSIAGGHTYLTAGAMQVTVTVKDVGGSQAVITDSASVIDIDVLGATLIELTPTQGSLFSGAVANVVDTNLATTAGQLVATIDWGDGTATSGTLSGVAGAFSVAGNHTYIGEGIYTLSATIAHVGGTATAEAAATITVADIGSLAATGVAVLATEGAAFSGKVATVSDTFAAPASVFMANIDWGDGTQTAGTVSGPNGQFTVSGQHTYTEEGTYKPVVTIADLAPGTLSATATLTASVADAAISAVNTTLHLAERQTFAGAVATFSDANPFATANDFTATIDWGDGFITAGTVSGSGDFQVSGSHAYTLGGTYTATVTIDDEGGSTAVAASKVLVADYPLTAAGAAIVGREGDLFAGVVATFADADPDGGRLGDFTATIDWGDGGVSAGLIIGGGGHYTVSGAYTFADVSDQVVIVINDAGGAAATVTVAATVADANTLTAFGSALAGTEGQTVSGVLATVADTYTGNPVSDFSASVEWGDGQNSAATVTGQSGQFIVNGSHVYAEAGNYTANVVFSHKAPGTAQATAAADIAIADAQLTATGAIVAATEGSTFSGQVAAFSDANLFSTADDFTATIQWGDGSTATAGAVTMLAAGSFVVTGTHFYAEEGQSLPVTVTILDKGGSRITAASTANVADAPLTAGAVTITATEGIFFSGTVATFTDANPNATAADFSSSIDWGDGSSATAGTVSAIQGGFAIVGAHTYGDEAAKLPITVSINDHGGSKATAASAARVVDAPLTATSITFTATEGITYTGTVATFSDANSGARTGDFTATIDWGDGTPATAGAVTAAQGGGFAVSGIHSYAEKASRQVTVSIHDVGGSAASAVSTAKVVDAPLLPGAKLTINAVAGAAFNGTLGTFTDMNPGGSLADFSAAIDWGDGSTGTALILTAPGEFIVSGAHTYINPAAAVPITITVTDVDGSKATVLASAHVASTHFAASGATITSIEGVTFSGMVGTCIDTDPNPAHYSATIDWGDGITTAGTIAVALGGGFVINGNHAFTAAGSGTMSIVVTNSSLDRLTVSSRSNISDAPLTPTGLSFTATEGTPFNGTVARFSDAGGGKLSDFSATIHWGDGGQSTGSVTTIAGGGYAVVGSHTYLNETAGVAVTVSISDVGGARATATSTAVVADAPLTLDPATITVPPGGLTNGLLLATFIDQGGAEPPSNYTATINWGDSTPASAGLIVSAGAGLQLTGNHQYLLPGPYTIEVLLRDQGGSTASATIDATVRPSANQLFIEAAYNNILARPVDNASLVSWSNQLNAGQSRGALAAALDHSAEYYADLIVIPAYERYLNRAPEAAGLAFWVDQLQNHGLTDEQLEAGFISSPEFYARAGGTDQAWIDAVYQTLLGRPADQAGESYWLSQLASGVSRTQVAVSFTAGPERESQRITDDYMHYLGRQPEPQGLSYWLGQFSAGLTNEDLITGFVSSDEYFGEHSVL